MIKANIERLGTEPVPVNNGFVEIQGWALADSGVDSIRVSLGEHAGGVVRGCPRPDLSARFPQMPDAMLGGFWCEIDVSDMDSPVETLHVEVRAEDGDLYTATLQIRLGPRREFGGARAQGCPWCRGAAVTPECGYDRAGYQLYRCGMCNAAFVWPIPPPDVLETYYSKIYWAGKDALAGAQPVHYDSDFIAALIRRHAPAATMVCDVGCGPGTLLNGLRQRGFEVFGQEYSVAAAEFARSAFNLNVVTGPLAALGNRRFDAMILRHMIEHSPSPLSDLETAVARLKSDGILVIVTPNINSHVSLLLRKQWEWFVPPTHLFYFCAESLASFAEMHGLEVVQSLTRKGDGVALSEVLPYFNKHPPQGLPSWILTRARAAEEVFRRRLEAGRDADDLGFGNELIFVARLRG